MFWPSLLPFVFLATLHGAAGLRETTRLDSESFLQEGKGDGSRLSFLQHEETDGSWQMALKKEVKTLPLGPPSPDTNAFSAPGWTSDDVSGSLEEIKGEEGDEQEAVVEERKEDEEEEKKEREKGALGTEKEKERTSARTASSPRAADASVQAVSRLLLTAPGDDCSYEILMDVKDEHCPRGFQPTGFRLGGGAFASVERMENSTRLIRASLDLDGGMELGKGKERLSERCQKMAEDTTHFAVKVMDIAGKTKMDGSRRVSRLLVPSEKARQEGCRHERLAKRTDVVPCMFKGWECGGVSYFVMESLAFSLREAVWRSSNAQPRRIDLKMSERLAKALVGAVEKMADAGCSHNDLHSKNIMFDWEGRVKLVDFGQSSCTKGLKELSDKYKRVIVKDNLGTSLCTEFWGPMRQEIIGGGWLKDVCDRWKGGWGYTFGSFREYADKPALSSEELCGLKIFDSSECGISPEK
uniref:Protein kinase domain-containing protein n=1 Tax=Chromera velia CCMP2878 TaxID=1169474 RepID=A0A0G4FU98_9ALVE|eukprot:Cvel_3761.t1-p1 / transcript=Cvel_3761.t1 / gene=Cvel_3761 / organism=Chromera_velia_CCMP2878 / gene_product=Hormonally up-regulated neu tumor-associated kinase, putative / transcript_product=Hormonally up-regulated neu tumor-associated kinase, putative / location=Cvel_scaffold157:103853-108202(+) / protein_length=468 / sequence_SO=supercontig / SO=protein_coding / is_pseudo=false